MFNLSHSDPRDVELESLIMREIHEMAADIHVHVSGGRVSISGITDDFETKREIERMLRGIWGIHEVISNIRVAPVGD